MVYFLKDKKTNYYKIGYTHSNLEQRIKEANKKYFKEFELVATIKGSYKEESYFHKFFKRFKVLNINGKELFYIPSVIDVASLIEINSKSQLTDPYENLSFLNKVIIRFKTNNFYSGSIWYCLISVTLTLVFLFCIFLAVCTLNLTYTIPAYVSAFILLLLDYIQSWNR